MGDQCAIASQGHAEKISIAGAKRRHPSREFRGLLQVAFLCVNACVSRPRAEDTSQHASLNNKTPAAEIGIDIAGIRSEGRLTLLTVM